MDVCRALLLHIGYLTRVGAACESALLASEGPLDSYDEGLDNPLRILEGLGAQGQSFATSAGHINESVLAERQIEIGR